MNSIAAFCVCSKTVKYIHGDLFLHRENDKTVERIDKETQQKLLLEMGFAREVLSSILNT